MEEVFLVFEGDAWLSTSSLILRGVYENFKDAVDTIMEAMADALMFNEDDDAKYVRNYLEANYQTPCLSTNYIIKYAELNKWEEI